MEGSDEVKLPSHVKLAWPALQVLRRAGAMTNAQMEQAVADVLDLSEAQRRLKRSKTGRGSRTMLDYRLAWSRTFLKSVGAARNVGPACWEATEESASITSADLDEAADKMFKSLSSRNR